MFFEVTARCCGLILDQACLVGEVRDGAAVVAQFFVLGRRAACLAEPVASVVLGLLFRDLSRMVGSDGLGVPVASVSVLWSSCFVFWLR